MFTNYNDYLFCLLLLLKSLLNKVLIIYKKKFIDKLPFCDRKPQNYHKRTNLWLMLFVFYIQQFKLTSQFFSLYLMKATVKKVNTTINYITTAAKAINKYIKQ